MNGQTGLSSRGARGKECLGEESSGVQGSMDLRMNEQRNIIFLEVAEK